MLDSSACIQVMRARGGPTAERLIRLGSETPLVSSIVLAELERGVATAARREHARYRLEELLARCDLRDFDVAAATCYGPIRVQLSRQGREIGPMDFLIAAHALSLNLPLLTSNVREFERVPGLQVISLDEA